MSDDQPLSPEESARIEKRAKRIKDYQDLFGTDIGQRVLHDMMLAHGFLSAHPAEPTQLALKEGERLVILRILRMMQIKPQQVIERINNEIL